MGTCASSCPQNLDSAHQIQTSAAASLGILSDKSPKSKASHNRKTTAVSKPSSSTGIMTSKSEVSYNLRKHSFHQKSRRCSSESSGSQDSFESHLTHLDSLTLENSESVRYAKEEVSCEKMPQPGSPEAVYACSLRIMKIVGMVKTNDATTDILVENLNYTVRVLNSVYDSEMRRLCHTEEDQELPDDSSEVPNEVRDWLATTFTTKQGQVKHPAPTFRSVANAIRAGITVEKLFRRMSSVPVISVPEKVMTLIKLQIDDWNFDIFEVNTAGNNHCMKYIGYDLLRRYNIVNRFKISHTVLENFLESLEEGYNKHGNPYHDATHGADVAQTCHAIMKATRLLDWLSDLEIFAVLFAALIHDFQHTGTTNNFHINTRSELALVYNDRGVLENHHISACFYMMRDKEDCCILENLTTEEHREFRNYVVEMVLNTDMSLHFQQLKNLKSLIPVPENIDKAKALSLLLHCADIGHPSKNWSLHEQWTNRLVEEFFAQGDREKEMGLPCSPLCDRNNTIVPQSQIGFIEFIVVPSFQLLGQMLDAILKPRVRTDSSSGTGDDEQPLNDSRCSLERRNGVAKPWEVHLSENKEKWRKKADELSPPND